ncbi:type II secretion system minor pseudopilin GspH [Legionella spiritensis]|uniref:type II secretion system minor pseudopilin GspH n=1 Tax=Legionella spiritensis TaxID=452 RepID=UPI000F70C6E6|nr:type II secretion system minor pseudopilin GspH [Legionella spiritensis]VEG90136.1 general secretion pathway protein LspH [Legionella spiritensis]
MRNNSGFTLIEILVVLVIVGITLTMTLLAFGDFGAGRKALMSAEQFVSYVKLVQQRAILEVTTLGINIDRGGYETYRFDNDTIWQPMSQQSLFHWKPFPKNVVVALNTRIRNHDKRPDIVINPSGDMSPFTITFGTMEKPEIATVYGQHNGKIVLGKSES